MTLPPKSSGKAIHNFVVCSKQPSSVRRFNRQTECWHLLYQLAQALNSDPIAAWSTRDKLTIAAYWARDQYESLKMYRNPDRTELAKARQAWFDAEAILSRAGRTLTNNARKMKRLLKWLFIAFWAMIIGIPLALDLWHYWDRWLALVGLVVVFWGGAYVLMRWDERREERAKATMWREAFKCKTPGLKAMNKRYRNQMMIESRVPRQKASDGPEPEIMLELSPEHPKLPQLSKTVLVGSSVPGFDVIDCTHYRN